MRLSYASFENRNHRKTKLILICNFLCKGVCNCSDTYVGTDCSHEKTIPPSNLTLPEEGLCKTSKRACAKTNIFGYFVTETVFAKLDEFQVNLRYDSTDISRFSFLSNISCYNLSKQLLSKIV